MQATYRLRADEITNNFLMGLKDTYQGREIVITVQEVEDETGRAFTLAQLETLSV